MRSCLAFTRYLAALLLPCATLAGANPLQSRLIALVPPGASMVSGFENVHGKHAGGRLVLSTHNNRLDLDDWLALAGVDPTRVYEEVIEAAASSSRGLLSEHLLLVAGRFNRRIIFRSAQANGSILTTWDDEQVVVVKAYEREAVEMKDVRWLAILDNRLALLGTPPMVQQALHRRKTASEPDAILVQRLKRLPSDVSAWDVLESSVTSQGDLLQLSPAWLHLLQGTDVLVVGLHFGSRVRVDFAAIAADREAVRIQPDDFAQVFGLPAPSGGFTSVLPGDPQNPANLSDRHGVTGSVAMTTEQFERWGERSSGRRSSPQVSNSMQARGPEQ